MKFKIFSICLALVAFTACETLNLDLQENPDQLNLASADPDLIFNTIQFNFNNQMSGLGFLTDGPVRLAYQFGTYNPGQNAMNGAWNQTYNTGTNIGALRTFAENDGLTFHLGAALIMQATMYVNLADFIGTAVGSEANNATEFPNPGLDTGQEIYQLAFNLIDEGVTNLQAGGRAPANDLYYGGNVNNWIAYANTLRLRMFLQTRLVDAAGATAGINGLVGQNLIDAAGEDLQFQYGTNPQPIESRHPLFTGSYLNGAGNYQPNGLIVHMMDRNDPRLRFYFYRQTNLDFDAEDLLECVVPRGDRLCNPGNLYYGRGHTNNQGIPGDQNLRTTYGVYPAGGQYDDDQFIAALSTSASGNGIAPLHLSSWTNFMLAEAALMLGTAGDPVTLLEQGVRQHMDKVSSFAPGNMTATQVNDYVNALVAEYNAAADNDARLDIIIREWYLSSHSTGLLSYNNYRRTGFPTFIQDPVIAAGPFIRSYFLPESELNSNTNEDFADQKQVTDQVFWDNNPAGFIN